MALSKKIKNCDNCENCENCDGCEDDNSSTTSVESNIFLSNQRIIFLSEEITKETSNTLASLLFYYEAFDPEKEIKIFLTSNGGDADAFIHMYDIINMIKAPVKIITIGKAYSAGALLLSCGKKGLRCAFKNSQVMIHQLQCVFPVFGETQIIENSNYFNYLENYNKSILAILAKKTGKSLKKVTNDCKSDLYLTPEEALKYGIIDFIVDDISQLIDIANQETIELSDIKNDAIRVFLNSIKDLEFEAIEELLLSLNMLDEVEETEGEEQIVLTEEQHQALTIFANEIKNLTDDEVTKITEKLIAYTTLESSDVNETN